LNSENSRVNAAKILAVILYDKKSLQDAIAIACPGPLDPFTQELCYGVLRFYFKLDFFLAELTRHPVKDIEIKALLLVGLYQLFFLDKPDYAVVTETVDAARYLKKAWATKLVNGVLRAALRSREVLQEKDMQQLSSDFSHPDWLIEMLQRIYPEDWQAILEHSNQHAPMTLRLNLAKQSREKYLAELKAQGTDAVQTDFSPYGICLERPLPVHKLYGFSQGWVSVQDEAAQLATPLLALSAGQVVLDGCAAPGGKTSHLLEIEPALKVIAVDISDTRLKRVEENLKRLGLSAEVVCTDIKKAGSCWGNAYFDRILLDVPCSATGVIRRHPDIKLLRKRSDIAKLAEEQYQMLLSMWPLLKPGGLLLYTTCSILPEENEKVLERFLKNHVDAIEVPIDAEWGRGLSIGRQIFPGESNMDGFYFGRIKKTDVDFPENQH
jgi:16S rRNA (cytosine967-C5)-methyltransferase